MQRAQHPADGVAQLAVALDGVFQDFRTEPLVVGIIGGADPEPQDVGAGILDHFLRLDGVAERFRHLAAVLVEREAVGQHDVVRRAAAGAGAFQQRGLEPAAMLVASLPDTSRCRRRRRSCARCGRGRGKFWRSSSTKAWVEPESNQTSRMSSTFCQPSRGELAPRKRSRAPSAYQASAPSCMKASTMRWLTISSCRISTEPSPFSFTNTAIGTPQARCREITQSGRLSIMPLMRFWPDGGTHRVTEIACSARARSVSPGFALPSSSIVLVHRDEPLRRVAEDHRLLRAPRMRILMLQPPARQQHAGLDQRLDHRLVGVALFALVVDDAFAGEAGRLIGEGAVFVDGVGDRGVDAARFQLARIRGPDVEVFAAMAGRGVHEAGAGIVGDVIAFEQGNGEFVAAVNL